MANSAQGSITIRRLRNGDSLFISFDSNNVDLYQGVDTESGAIFPDWTVTANQPIRTPRVSSSRGYAVTLSLQKWYRAGQEISFSVNGGDGWWADATGTFKMQVDTGALKICKNLANRDSVGNVNLKWSAVATVAGSDQTISKDLDVRIGNMGASSYVGTLLAESEQISSLNTSTTLSTSLRLGTEAVANYHTKWFKDNEQLTDFAGQKTLEVTRSMVDGIQLFICEFYKTISDVSPIYRAGIRIIDVSDEFQINFTVTSGNEVDTGTDVTVVASIMNMTTKTVVPSGDADWTLTLLNNSTLETIRVVNTDTITITTADTDKNGKQYDVDLIAEAKDF
jgi:hypothetical protein